MAYDFVPDACDGLTSIERTLLRVASSSGAKRTKSRPILDATRGLVPGHERPLVYDALVRLTAPYWSRAPWFDGVGNFGSIDADPPAQSIYTEVRRNALGDTLVGEDGPDVPADATPDERARSLLATNAASPLSGASLGLLANGAWEGISAVPSHQFDELAAALVLRLRQPSCTLDDVLAVLPGPDFASGGIVPNPDEIREAYATGAGAITIRASVKHERDERGRPMIVVTELPFLVAKGGDTGAIVQIIECIQAKTVATIHHVSDQSSRKGMEIVLELGKGDDPHATVEQLYANTDLEVALPVRMVALDASGVPRQFTLLELLDATIEHQRSLVVASGVSGDAAIAGAVEARITGLAERFGNARRTTIAAT